MVVVQPELLHADQVLEGSALDRVDLIAGQLPANRDALGLFTVPRRLPLPPPPKKFAGQLIKLDLHKLIKLFARKSRAIE